VVAALAVAAPAMAGETVSRTYEVQDFSAIEISGAYELDVAVGGDYAVMLEGPEDEMARALVTVKDGALVLASKKHRGDRDGVKATVTMPALESLSVSGVVDADIRGVDAGAFKISLSGVGEVDIQGRCKSLDARVSGVGELDAKSFECASVDVSLSGMGEASVYARDRAKAEVSGMGEINIYGSPKTVDKRGGFFSKINVH
ncbi:MAG TPA: head GIN domain-containing protein, partial [Parvularculaceae bacterium]|nr:head GIN domain-containing protein [Parvularculaceae bacterium]